MHRGTPAATAATAAGVLAATASSLFERTCARYKERINYENLIKTPPIYTLARRLPSLPRLHDSARTNERTLTKVMRVLWARRGRVRW